MVIFHTVKESAPTERVAVFIDEATAGTCILKGLLVGHRQQFRLTGRHLLMTVHEADERFQPMGCHLHVAVQDNVIGSFHLFQSLVIAVGKAPVLLQLNQSHLRIVFLEKGNRLICRGIIGYIHRCLTAGMLQQCVHVLRQHLHAVPVQYNNRNLIHLSLITCYLSLGCAFSAVRS